GGPDVRTLRRGPLQRRFAKLQSGRRLAGCGRTRAHLVLGAAESRAVRCAIADRTRAAGAAWLPGADQRLRAALHHRLARRVGADFLEERFQVTPSLPL